MLLVVNVHNRFQLLHIDCAATVDGKFNNHENETLTCVHLIYIYILLCAPQRALINKLYYAVTIQEIERQEKGREKASDRPPSILRSQHNNYYMNTIAH